MRTSTWAILFFSFFLVTCKTGKRVTRTNLAYLYFNEKTVIHPQFKVYHNSESTSTLYVKVNSDEILYSRNNPQKDFQGKMIMRIDVFKAGERKSISSDTIYLIDKGGAEKDKYLQGELEFDLPFGEKYLAEVTFDDLYRMQFVQDVLLIDKSSEYSSENYLIKNENGEVLFGQAFDPGASITIESNHNLPSQLTVRKYENHDYLPPPPFVVQNQPEADLVEDKVYKIPRKDKNTIHMKLGDAGIYYLNEEDIGGGLALLVFHSYYPYIKTLASMVRPMRYITTKQEYKNLVDNDRLKKNVDEFWFKIAGNAERAAEIIEEYYSRVEIANRYFTSFSQGWKTDRGLIYMIYGPPSSVTKTEDYESWSYNEKTNIMTVEFTFRKVDHHLSDNHYKMERALGYKSSWYRAIDGWRQGRVF